MVKKKILIVDDEGDICGLFTDVLSNAGYLVASVSSGKACLLLLRQETFDLILLDMFMPGMSGRETFERIIRDGTIKDNTVAFLTVAQLGEKGRAELSYLGAVDYINKPIDNDELVSRVKEIFKVKRKKQ